MDTASWGERSLTNRTNYGVTQITWVLAGPAELCLAFTNDDLSTVRWALHEGMRGYCWKEAGARVLLLPLSDHQQFDQ